MSAALNALQLSEREDPQVFKVLRIIMRCWRGMPAAFCSALAEPHACVPAVCMISIGGDQQALAPAVQRGPCCIPEMYAAITLLRAGQMLQSTALSDLLERQSCEKAALERVFVDASERDTPGASIVSGDVHGFLLWHSILSGRWGFTCCGHGCCCSRCLLHLLCCVL